jgi:hypothetical protein
VTAVDGRVANKEPTVKYLMSLTAFVGAAPAHKKILMVVRLLMRVLKAEALQAARHAEIGEICLAFSGPPSRVAAPVRAMKAQPGLFTRAFETISQPVQHRHNSKSSCAAWAWD